MLEPEFIQELKEMVTSHDQVLAIGGGTKSRLSVVGEHVKKITTRRLSGITEYDPSEYTFTALAGTSVSEIHEAVQAKGQFLPCSALLRDSGATLGGAIASGLSGPGRFRFGGLRDFLLGIQYVSGEGKLITSGGRVVKNAAGFDLSKFMVGSLGRYGILTEVTFKVFPMPPTLETIKVNCDSHETATQRICRAASSRWELYAIDYDASEKALYLRLGGPENALQDLIKDILSEWPGETEALSQEDGETYWEHIRRLGNMPGNGCAAKIPVTPTLISPLQKLMEQIPGVHLHYSVAGNVAGVMTPGVSSMIQVGEALNQLGLPGMTFIGDHNVPLWLGKQQNQAISDAVKEALDPQHRFPKITES